MRHILLLVLDLGGTLVFALSGGLLAVKRRLDIFGVLVLSFAAGNAGGIGRDLLIGAVPPAAIADWRYFAVSALAGLVAFFWYPTADRYRNNVLWCDAVGLAFFATAGADKALFHGLSPATSALLGMLTGVGGGMLRDVLVTEIPTVLRADLYALAALAGAAVVAIAPALHFPTTLAALGGGVLCFAMRFGAIRHGWRLPSAAPPQPQPETATDEGRRRAP